MKYTLNRLPPYEKVLSIRKGEYIHVSIPTGFLMVKIHHTLRVCNLVIFFGIVDDEFIHGWMNYERKEGEIESDE